MREEEKAVDGEGKGGEKNKSKKRKKRMKWGARRKRWKWRGRGQSRKRRYRRKRRSDGETNNGHSGEPEEAREDGPEPTSPSYHAIDGQELIASLQAAVPLGHAPRDDAGDVDGRVLLLAAHHVEAQAFLRLGQLHHPRVGVAFTGCKGCNCGLGGIKKRCRFSIFFSILLQ